MTMSSLTGELADLGKSEPQQNATLIGLSRADLAVWDAESPAELIYRLGTRPLHARIHGGH